MIHDFKAIKRLAKIINILYLPTVLPCKIAEKRERQNRNTAGTENFCINFVARNVFEKVCKVYKKRIMLKIVGIMLLGVFTGYLLKNYQLRWVQKWIMLAIWLLLFLLGIAVGTNGEIMNNLDTIGLKGLILALGGVSGSVILAWVVYRFFFMRRDESSVS